MSIAQTTTCQIKCDQTHITLCTICYEFCTTVDINPDTLQETTTQTRQYYSCYKCNDPTCSTSSSYQQFQDQCISICCENTYDVSQQTYTTCLQDQKDQYKWVVIGGIIFVGVVLAIAVIYCVYMRIKVCIIDLNEQKEKQKQENGQSTKKDGNGNSASEIKKQSSKNLSSNYNQNTLNNQGALRHYFRNK